MEIDPLKALLDSIEASTSAIDKIAGDDRLTKAVGYAAILVEIRGMLRKLYDNCGG